jgi:CheY-like chemotaxis protein
VPVSKRVLIVDDHKDLREIITRRVEEAGHTPLATATNGPEALLRAADDVPDVVILDYMMPGMTGEEVAREMRARFPEIKIIACSGIAKSKPYWADAYVDKNQLVDLEFVLGSV